MVAFLGELSGVSCFRCQDIYLADCRMETCWTPILCCTCLAWPPARLGKDLLGRDQDIRNNIVWVPGWPLDGSRVYSMSLKTRGSSGSLLANSWSLCHHAKRCHALETFIDSEVKEQKKKGPRRTMDNCICKRELQDSLASNLILVLVILKNSVLDVFFFFWLFLFSFLSFLAPPSPLRRCSFAAPPPLLCRPRSHLVGPRGRRSLL